MGRRILVVFSLVWMTLVVLIVAYHDEATPPRAFLFFFFSTPVWLAWAIAWIWGASRRSAQRQRAAGPGWVHIGERALQHPLYGISGWAILLGVAILTGAIKTVLLYYKEEFDLSGIDNIPGLRWFLAMEIVSVWGIALGELYCLYLLVRKNALFPAIFKILMIFSILWPLIQMPLLVTQVRKSVPNFAYSDMISPKDISQYIGGTLSTCIWLLYVARSRRINVTFAHRVRANDPLAQIDQPAVVPAGAGAVGRAVPLS